MRIAADKNIPEIESACEGLGEIRLFDSRDQKRLHDLLQTADVLLCRSTIAVNAALLEGTPVRFVTTATSGTDHFDTNWLDAQGITYASAAGSNARSVAEWWAASMLELHARGRVRLEGATVGIVGVGHVGTQVADVAHALGMHCRFNDPPRAARGEQPVAWSPDGFVSMEEILSCDIVTLHVPLTREGKYPTAGFFGERQFGCMRPGALFVNAARGGVMDAPVVLAWSAAGNPLVLDVFPGEPHIDPALVRTADIATPHIAGHAWDGKLLGTEMVARALREWFSGTSSQKLDTAGLEGTKTQRLKIFEKADLSADLPSDVYGEVLERVRSVYDVRVDDAALRRAVEMEPEAAAAEFARLRAEYPLRREFAASELEVSGLSGASIHMLTALGFRRG
ncbi:MAG: 4-phosphoerythronate dehydrogenase [Bacteroidota bacterium]